MEFQLTEFQTQGLTEILEWLSQRFEEVTTELKLTFGTENVMYVRATFLPKYDYIVFIVNEDGSWDECL